MGMRSLVTGGAGFLGSHVAEELLIGFMGNRKCLLNNQQIYRLSPSLAPGSCGGR
jgi:nucleoside-diphosphate-sugar epimerase